MSIVKNTDHLGQEPISKLLRNLAIPASTAMFVNALYNIVDTIFVGRLVGWKGIAALAIANPVQMILLALGQIFGIGAASVISRALGANNHEKANKAAGNAYAGGIIISVLAALIGTLLMNEILTLFGASSDILPYAYDYLIIILPFCIFKTLSVISNNLIRSEGNAKMAMITMASGALVNIILDPIFIYFLDLGIQGAAIATVLAQAVSALISFLYLKSPKGSIKLSFNYLKIDLELIKTIITIGIPSFFRQAGASVLAIVLNNLLGIYGDIYISIYGIILKITNFTLMPVLGIFQGMSPILGYNFGAKKYHRVKEVISLARKSGMLIMFIAMIIIEIFPSTIISVFTDDQTLITNGLPFVRIFFLSYWIIPLNMSGSNSFQAMGKGRKALFTALLRQFLVLIPVLLISFKLFGLYGIYISFPISDFIASSISNYLITKELRELF